MKLFRILSVAMMVLHAVEEAKEVLALLAKDDYEGASAMVLSHPALKEELDHLPAEALAAAPLLLPILLKALDRVLPEEALLAAMG